MLGPAAIPGHVVRAALIWHETEGGRPPKEQRVHIWHETLECWSTSLGCRYDGREVGSNATEGGMP